MVTALLKILWRFLTMLKKTTNEIKYTAHSSYRCQFGDTTENRVAKNLAKGYNEDISYALQTILNGLLKDSLVRTI